MKLSILRQSFLTALEIGGQVCGSSNIPMANMVKVKLKDGEIKVTSTNLDIFISKTMEIEYTGEAIEFCIELKIIMPLLKSVKDAFIDVDIEGSRMVLKHQKGEVEIPIHKSDTFPRYKIEGDAKEITLGAEFFVTSLKRAVKFVDKGKDADRPPMRTVYYYLLGDHIKVAASDGLSLCSMRMKYEGDKEVLKKEGIMIPSQAVPVLTSIIPLDGDIVIKDRERNFSIAIDGCSVFVAKVNGKYPKVESIIPSYERKTTVNTKEFMEAVNRCGLMTDKSSMITLSISNGMIDMKGEDIDYQTKSNEFILTSGDLDGFKVCLSATNLLSVLKEIGASNMEIKAKSSDRPVMLNAEGDEDNFFLLMPMRLPS